MAKLKAPCQDCPDRQLGCHGSCEKYKEYHESCVQASREYSRGMLEHSPYHNIVLWTEGRRRAWRNSK